ncbi:MAG: type II toxin-antitoxin system VapC family toxin [Pyrinomonadaceae bacterium]
MSLTIIDTDILIDEARGISTAADFLNRISSNAVLAISVVTQMELTVGCRNKTEQHQLVNFLRRFQVLSISTEVSESAIRLLQQYNLSHGLLIPDALIAATGITYSEPLATKNQRDFRFIEGLDLIQYPT